MVVHYAPLGGYAPAIPESPPLLGFSVFTGVAVVKWQSGKSALAKMEVEA